VINKDKLNLRKEQIINFNLGGKKPNKRCPMMNQRKVYTLGETVYDLLFKEMQPVRGIAGGATLNSSVTLGRLGVPVHFISEFGKDLLGNHVAGFLHKNGVDLSGVYRYKDGATTLSIASLDEKNNASYNFYQIMPKEHLLIPFPEIKAGDILLFGSFFAISPILRKPVLEILKFAKSQGALLVYDPNFRLSHKDQLESFRPYMLENIAMADIVRGSDEDFYHIFGARTPDEAFKSISDQCRQLIYTSSHNGVTWIHPAEKGFVPSQKIDPVSTRGAGDTFNAGVVYSLLQQNITVENLTEVTSSQWDEIALTGVAFASEVCMQYENYISKEFARTWKDRMSKNSRSIGSAVKK
jgi:fructokinase